MMIRTANRSRRDVLESIAEQTGNEALQELLDLASDDDLNSPEIAQLLAWGRPAMTGLFAGAGE